MVHSCVGWGGSTDRVCRLDYLLKVAHTNIPYNVSYTKSYGLATVGAKVFANDNNMLTIAFCLTLCLSLFYSVRRGVMHFHKCVCNSSVPLCCVNISENVSATFGVH